jgi:hypothetical protein
MATYYVIETTRVGLNVYKAGQLVDSNVVDTNAITTAGGILVDSSDAQVAGVASVVNARRLGRGIDDLEADKLMRDAYDVSQGLNLANLNAGLVVKRTVTIDFTADAFSALTAGVKTFSKNIGAALPATARLMGYQVGEGTFTAFDDATHGTYGLEIGTAGTAALVQASLDVKAGQTGFPKAGTAGVKGFDMAALASLQLVAKLTSSVDLNTVTAGHVVVDVFYIPLA